MKKVYLDYAAATPVRREVLMAMRTYEEEFGNPSSVHSMGMVARELIEDARRGMREVLHADTNDLVVFTSGGTESINLALLGVARANRNRGRHIITSRVEHKAVLACCAQLEKEGFEVDYVEVDAQGRVCVSDVQKLIRKDTILVSIQYVNNETGMIQPIDEISRMLKLRSQVKLQIKSQTKSHTILFHTDACQAGLLDLDVGRLGVDLLTLNSSKVYGPHGMGLLYVRFGVLIRPVIFGGGQEWGLRSGTENVVGIRGFVCTLELLQKEKNKELRRLHDLRQKFVSELQKKISDVFVVSDLEMSVPTLLSVGFRGVEADTLVRALSAQGIYISAGSACSAQEIQVSYVLRAMKLSEKVARGVVRLSFGRGTTWKDLKRVVRVVEQGVSDLRRVGLLS